MGVGMQAAARRNLGLLALGIVVVALLWQVPGRQAPRAPGPVNLTPNPTPTAESHWRPVYSLQASGPRDLCGEGVEITVPGPWRIRAEPADREVQVRVLDKRTKELFGRVWAGGSGHGTIATLPQGNGIFCLQVEAEGDYTLYVEAWEAPQG